MITVDENYLKEEQEWMKDVEESSKILMKSFAENMNPVKDIPKVQMRLYSIASKYFDTFDELELFCKENNLSLQDSSTVDYLSEFAGVSDVIYVSPKMGKADYYRIVNEDTYEVFDFWMSSLSKKFIWERKDGNIRYLYNSI